MRILSLELTDYRNYARAELRPCAGVTVLARGQRAGQDQPSGSHLPLLHGALAPHAAGPRTGALGRGLLPRMRGGRAARRHARGGYRHTPGRAAQDPRQRLGDRPFRGTDGACDRGVVFPGRPAADQGRAGRAAADHGHRPFADTGFVLLRLQRYARALKQRNELLRTGRLETLDSWDEQLCREGTRIMAARADYIERLNEAAARTHGDHRPRAGKALHRLRAQRGRRRFARGPAAHARGGRAAHDHQRRGTPRRLALLRGRARTAAVRLAGAAADGGAVFAAGGIGRGARRERRSARCCCCDDVMSELDPERRRRLLAIWRASRPSSPARTWPTSPGRGRAWSCAWRGACLKQA